MPTLIHLALAALLASTSALAGAADNPLSVHVLDLQSGQPTPGVRVQLEQRDGAQWRTLSQGVTNAQGRIAALAPPEQPLAAGDYRIVFETGEHYARQGKPTFFPRIPVDIHIDEPASHYHVPLLLSPYGYSTYRGN